jgi:DNA sulfur modification protein DndB
MLRQISIFDEEDLPPELRIQRNLNKSRIPEIANYILDNPDDYVFSALTASIDAEVIFEPFPNQDKLGVLKVSMEARFIINDGQHRRAAILEALKKRPELERETIPVVFFLDAGLQRCQQMFADLNRHATRPSRSLSLLYEHRSDKVRLAKLVLKKSETFRDIVDLEKSSLSKRSPKLFTLSAFHNACAELIQGLASGDMEKDAETICAFWESVAQHFPDWKKVAHGQLPASQVREDSIHSYGIALQAIARSGNSLLKQHPQSWKNFLKGLKTLNWSRNNAQLWEGRTLVAGRVSKSSNHVTLTTNIIKQAMELPLSKEEQAIEAAYLSGSYKQHSLETK